MNLWTQRSIDFANQRNYLDELYRIYPMEPEGMRQLDNRNWQAVKRAFGRRANRELIASLLDLPLFPIKDSYVAYLKRDRRALDRNPATVERLAGRLFELGLDELRRRCSEPKETNRQIGPLFRHWIEQGSLGVPLLRVREFTNSRGNAVLMGSDIELTEYARNRLNYRGSKRLDFVARFNGRHVIGEAKFLTDFGGHQNAQFEDAKALLRERNADAIRVAVLDGVLYIRGRNKMHRYLHENPNYNILSALLLRDFLHSI